MNATLAADVANANPGSQIQVHWVGGSTGDSDVSDFLSLLCPQSGASANDKRKVDIRSSGLTTSDPLCIT